MKYLVSSGRVIGVITEQEELVERLFSTLPDSFKEKLKLVDQSETNETLLLQYLKKEMQFRLVEYFGFNEPSDELVEIVANHLHENHENVFNYDEIDNKINDFLVNSTTYMIISGGEDIRECDSLEEAIAFISDENEVHVEERLLGKTIRKYMSGPYVVDEQKEETDLCDKHGN